MTQASRRLMTGAVASACVAAALLTPRPAPGLLNDVLLNSGLALWAVCIGLTWVALLRSNMTTAESVVAAGAFPRPAWGHRLALATAGLAWAALTLVNTPVPALWQLSLMPVHAQFVLFVVGVLLTGYGVSAVAPPTTQATREWGLRVAQSPLLWLTVAALLYRVIWLGRVHTFIDEMHFVEPVADLRAGWPLALLAPLNEIAAFSGVMSYLHYLGTLVFGVNYTGLRVASAVIGAAAVPGIYLLTREVFNRRTAYLAAAFMAVYPPHVHFSRTSLNNIADATLGVLGVGLLLYAVRRGQRWAYGWAGVCFGLTYYFYEGGRLVLTALLVLFPLWGLLRYRSRARGLYGTAWHGLVLTFIAFGMVAAPMNLTLLATRDTSNPRLSEKRLPVDYWTTLFLSPQPLPAIEDYLNRRLGPPLRHYVQLPDGNGFYYGGNHGLVLPWVVPLFLLGTGVAVWAAVERRSGAGVLVLWLLLTVVGNSLIIENVWSPRFVVSFPVVSVLCAAGLSYTVDVLRTRHVSRVLGGVAVLVLVSQVTYYTLIHIPAYQISSRPWRDYADVSWRVPLLPAGTVVRLVHLDDVDSDVARYERLMGVDYDYETVPADRFTPLPSASTPVAYFVDPTDTATLDRLEARYGPRALGASPFNVPASRQYVLFFVPAAVG